jgi:zinc and cadmium transporter
MSLSTLQWIILMTLLNGLIGLVGIFSLILSKKSLNKILLFLVAFSVGSLLGGAFFHLIPEAFEELKAIKTIVLIFIGIIAFYLIEKLLHWHHCHKNEECEVHPYTHLVLYGDSIHNFIDGLIMAGSFIIGIPFGILTSLLIILHELPQEMGDFAVLVHGGFTKRKAIFYNFIAQLTAVLGGVLGFFFLNLKNYAVYLLPFAAGGFIYIAIMDLIPEVFKQKHIVKIIKNLLAIILGLLVLISSKLLIG